MYSFYFNLQTTDFCSNAQCRFMRIARDNHQNRNNFPSLLPSTRIYHQTDLLNIHPFIHSHYDRYNILYTNGVLYLIHSNIKPDYLSICQQRSDFTYCVAVNRSACLTIKNEPSFRKRVPIKKHRVHIDKKKYGVDKTTIFI